jgi:hypothetical protein
MPAVVQLKYSGLLPGEFVGSPLIAVTIGKSNNKMGLNKPVLTKFLFNIVFVFLGETMPTLRFWIGLIH